LARGDRRNVVDRYRYWRVDAIVADLDERRHPFHVAVENWRHDLNIGTVVRNANAFLAAAVHIVGRRRWNRRGAMVTERYQRVVHHPTVDDLLAWSDVAEPDGLPIVGIDNLPGSMPLETVELPGRCLLLFGQEGPGLSDAARGACAQVCSITMFGSTRSVWPRASPCTPGSANTRSSSGPCSGCGQSGSSGISRPRSRPSSTARVTAPDPNRSHTSSIAESSAFVP
jgi:hypothetical protein